MIRSGYFWLLVFAAVTGGGWWWSRHAAPVVNNPPREGPIIALGDSLTAGIGAAPGRAYPDQLAGLIGRPVLNRGVSGETIDMAAQRVADQVVAEQPAIVLVLLGGNDLLQVKTLDDSFQKLETVIREIQAGGAMVVLIGIDGLTPVGGIGGRFRALARRSGCVYVDDILDGIFSNPKLMADMIHPNTEGYRIMAERIAASLRPYLK